MEAISHQELTDVQKELRLYVRTIEGWIASCQLEVQIPICKNIVQSHFVERFSPLIGSGELDFLEYESIRIRLEDAISDQLRKVRYYQ